VYILDSDVLTVIDGSRRNAAVSAWYDTLNETDIYLAVTAIYEKAKNTARLAKRGQTTAAKQVEATLNNLKTNFARSDFAN
jgi:hypothetical protein